ncbi:hypothetical protein BC830DRAFT_1115856 [Chytriomyces sp. MP71]|nr:hypothetical protein BC830DRAFT_1115856 [Chytriomyces sp. MP71]
MPTQPRDPAQRRASLPLAPHSRRKGCKRKRRAPLTLRRLPNELVLTVFELAGTHAAVTGLSVNREWRNVLILLPTLFRAISLPSHAIALVLMPLSVVQLDLTAPPYSDTSLLSQAISRAVNLTTLRVFSPAASAALLLTPASLPATITSLHITFPHHLDSPAICFPPLSQALRGLTSLTVDSTTSPRPVSLKAFLLAFKDNPRVNILRLIGISMHLLSQLPLAEAFPTLKSLELRSFAIESVGNLRNLAGFMRMRGMDVLTLGAMRFRFAEDVSAFLAKLRDAFRGKQVNELRISFSKDQRTRYCVEVSDLVPWTKECGVRRFEFGDGCCVKQSVLTRLFNPKEGKKNGDKTEMAVFEECVHVIGTCEILDNA